MTNVLDTHIETHEAAPSRFFIDYSLPAAAWETINNFEAICETPAADVAALFVEHEGANVAAAFAEQFMAPSRNIGNHTYWTEEREERLYLCTHDEIQGLAVFFNCPDDFKAPFARRAELRDYLDLLRDLKPIIKFTNKKEEL